MEINAIRLNANNMSDLLTLTDGKYPPAREICSAVPPVAPCTRVYGCYADGELVAMMTATYSIVFPHKDGSRMVQISGAYTKEEYRHQGLATKLLSLIQYDAMKYFHADYLCCDSTANGLYEKFGFKSAPEDETRMWKKVGRC